MKLFDSIVGFTKEPASLTGWRRTEYIESQQIRVGQSRAALIIMAAGGLIFFYALSIAGNVPPQNSILWSSVCFLAALIRDFTCRQVANALKNPSTESLYLNELSLYITSLSNTIAMGSGFWFIAAGASERVVFAVTIVCCVYAVGTTVNSGMHSKNIKALLISNLGQGILFLLLFRDPPEIAAAFAISGLTYILIKFSARISAVFEESMEIRDENREKNELLEKQKLIIEESLNSAKAANDDKNRFLAAASHDLRQPLHAMTLFLGSLRKSVTDDLSIELVNKIDQTTSVLHEQFDSLLDLSKFDAGVIEPNISLCRFDILLQKVVDSVAPDALNKGLSIDAKIEPITIRTDLLLMERLIRNLLVNSVNFTEKGSILATGRLEDSKLVIEVSDTGQGISEEEKVRIFQDYYQVQNRARSKGKGSGLGLAIVKRIATLLNYELAITSEEEKGSTFSVTLPSDCIEKSINSAEEDYLDLVELSSSSNEGEFFDLKGAKFLMVDDDKSILDALSGLVNNWGGISTLASSFHEVKELVNNSEEFDAVILDDMLAEDTTGLEIAKFLSEHMDKSRIIITTGNTAKKRLAEIKNCGFDVLTKPVKREKLNKCLLELSID